MRSASKKLSGGRRISTTATWSSPTLMPTWSVERMASFCRNPTDSAEIAAAGSGDDPQLAQAGGKQADGAVESFHPAGHQQRAGLDADLAVPLPDRRRADHVRHPGLVFQAEENHAARRPWLLPVRDQSP